MTIGNGVTLGRMITFELCGEGRITIGDNVLLTHNVIVSASEEIIISAQVGVAENVSIRDAVHRFEREKPVQSQPERAEKIFIGRDAVVGANTVILPGSVIPDGAVIGPLSIVTRQSMIRPYSINQGSPLRLITMRR